MSNKPLERVSKTHHTREGIFLELTQVAFPTKPGRAKIVSRKTLTLSQDLKGYALSVSLREAPILAELRAETATIPMAAMQISPEQGQLMALLAKLVDARRCIEIGVFTGYSTLAVALAIPADGEIVACDISEEWTAIARSYWQRAGVADKIRLILAPATETLDQLFTENGQDCFDFAFIDADKINYWNYFERTLKLVRRGGLILIDNVLWGGAVIDTDNNDEDTVAIREFNERLSRDTRVDISLLPAGDGLTLARRK